MTSIAFVSTPSAFRADDRRGVVAVVGGDAMRVAEVESR
jgi:hypothetical protein